MSKYDIDVKLVGEDGNIFNLLEITQKEMRRSGVEEKDIKHMKDLVLSSHSYNEALMVIANYVNVI